MKVGLLHEKGSFSTQSVDSRLSATEPRFRLYRRWQWNPRPRLVHVYHHRGNFGLGLVLLALATFCLWSWLTGR